MKNIIKSLRCGFNLHPWGKWEMVDGKKRSVYSPNPTFTTSWEPHVFQKRICSHCGLTELRDM